MLAASPSVGREQYGTELSTINGGVTLGDANELVIVYELGSADAGRTLLTPMEREFETEDVAVESADVVENTGADDEEFCGETEADVDEVLVAMDVVDDEVSIEADDAKFCDVSEDEDTELETLGGADVGGPARLDVPVGELELTSALLEDLGSMLELIDSSRIGELSSMYAELLGTTELLKSTALVELSKKEVMLDGAIELLDASLLDEIAWSEVALDRTMKVEDTSSEVRLVLYDRSRLLMFSITLEDSIRVVKLSVEEEIVDSGTPDNITELDSLSRLLVDISCQDRAYVEVAGALPL